MRAWILFTVCCVMIPLREPDRYQHEVDKLCERTQERETGKER